MIRRLAFLPIAIVLCASAASAQAPADVPPPKPVPAVFATPQAANAAKRAIARQNPLPRRVAAVRANELPSDRDVLSSRGRFANPGGVGRYSEYYTPFTPTSQVDLHPSHAVRFDQGGGPNRAEQIAAFRAGQMRTRNIQDNINAYGRPYGAYGAGFGFGYGLGVGRGYGYPY